MMRRPFERLPQAAATTRVDPAASVAPIQDALSRLFDDQQVSVTPVDGQTGTHTAEVAVSRGGEVVATSSAAAMMESLLLVNADVYITGSRSLDDAALPPSGSDYSPPRRPANTVSSERGGPTAGSTTSSNLR